VSPFTPEWRAARARQEKARKYVASAFAEPLEDDVAWLAQAAAFGDVDHARWELRYARMAIAVFVAERDALNDQTGSDIAAAVSTALSKDSRVSPDMRPLAERQYSDRLHGYREAFFARGGTSAMGEKLGRVLLAFSSDGARSAGTPLARATEVLQGYVTASNDALREAYGTAELPEHLPPSEVAGGK
jgi:hypothetical protein